MKHSWLHSRMLLVVLALLLPPLLGRLAFVRTSAAASPRTVTNVAEPQQYPIVDKISDRIIQKYQASSCQQLYEEKAQQQSKPKSAEEQRAITILHNDPQMRQAFINKIAAPIANKLFECGMIP